MVRCVGDLLWELLVNDTAVFRHDVVVVADSDKTLSCKFPEGTRMCHAPGRLVGWFVPQLYPQRSPRETDGIGTWTTQPCILMLSGAFSYDILKKYRGEIQRRKAVAPVLLTPRRGTWRNDMDLRTCVAGLVTPEI